MKQQIIEYIKDNQKYTLSQLAKEFGNDIEKTLLQLQDENIIYKDEEYYGKLETFGIYQGTLRLNERGFGFIDLEFESLFIAKKYINFAMDQDIVLVQKIDGDKENEGKIVKIVQRHFRYLIGTIKKYGSKFKFLSDQFVTIQPIQLQKENKTLLQDNYKVKVEIIEYAPKVVCKVVELIGFKYDVGVDVMSILASYNITQEFSSKVYQQAKVKSDNIEIKASSQRKDLRSLYTITIDGSDSKDLDDAISIQQEKQGYCLYVHISDVSTYVTKDSAIDKEACDRGTSVYVCDRVVPMLPPVLSNGVCSLHPKVDRLTLTCEMHFDFEGKCINYDVYPSIICSNQRCTYDEVYKIIQKKNKKTPLDRFIEKAHHLYQLLLAKVSKRGMIDFNILESKLLVNQKGKVYDVIIQERNDAHRLIEMFMISANEAVAQLMYFSEFPSIYRVHDAIDEEKVKEFMSIAKQCKIPFKANIKNIYPSSFNKALEYAKDKKEYSYISKILLRSMQKAFYSTKCSGHFGLASKYYLHFTSPIRRYPDLIVHRNLWKYYFNQQQPTSKDIERDEEIAFIASEREKRAVNAQRDVFAYKVCEFMKKKIGQKFKAKVSTITKKGFFVELDNGVEGFVRLPKLTITNERSVLYRRKVYGIGDEVNVRLIGSDQYRREIDFELL